MKKGARSLLTFSIIVLILFVSFVLAEVITGVDVNYNNLPPIFSGPISNITIAVNTNFTNALNLSNYFSDNETINFTVSSTSNVLVTIVNDMVSFYPNHGFFGNESMHFTATDIFGESTNSSQVYVIMYNDTTPPTWSSPSIDLTSISQNTVVTLSAIWNDNIQLRDYFLAINQGSGWVNNSPSSFSGTQNTSTGTVQVSASGGSTVFWRYIAIDTSGNVNQTSIQNFSVQESEVPEDSTTSEDEDDDSSSSSTTTVLYQNQTIVRYGLSVDPEYPITGLKIDIIQGTSKAISFKLTNTGNVNLQIDLSIEGLIGIDVLISNQNVTLEPGESRIITVQFSVGKNTLPDIYFGDIVIKSVLGIKKIPIIVQVNEPNPLLEVNITLDDLTEFQAGDIIMPNITLRNLGDITDLNITFYSAITDLSGNVLDAKFDNFIFETQRISFTKELKIPEEAKEGRYLIIVRAEAEENRAIDSKIFIVGERFTVAGFIKAYYIIILILASSFIISLLMIRARRNKEKLRILNLYLMITEMNNLLKSGKLNEAIDIYIRIKSIYGEPVSRTALQNKESLKKEMENLADRLGMILKKDLEKVESPVQKSFSTSEKNDKPKQEAKPDKPDQIKIVVQNKEKDGGRDDPNQSAGKSDKENNTDIKKQEKKTSEDDKKIK